MNSTQATKSAALYYGINLLRFLLSARLISDEEYAQIVSLQAEQYDPRKRMCLK